MHKIPEGNQGKLLITILTLVIFSFISSTVYGARIKDITSIGGVRDNQLIGYGLVVGLAGTGDDIKNGFTRESIANLLTRHGLSMRDRSIKARNVAAVMLTATLPPFAKLGSRIDVIVSSLGDAKSLLGGTLIMSPLRGVDGEVYAIAQGSVTIGGFAAAGAGAGAMRNHTSAGMIASGAIVEKELVHDFRGNNALTLNLNVQDFTTAGRIAAVINSQIKGVEAKQIDSSTVMVRMVNGHPFDVISLVTQIEGLRVPVDVQAVVVMNEKTGTVVMGENVRISTVAIAHGNLSIQIREETRVSQPLPFAPAPPPDAQPSVLPGGVIIAPGGYTVVTRDAEITVTEEKRQLMLVSQGVTIQEVVRALNAIGVTPRDLITILQTIKAAGALQAELRVI